VLSKGKSNGCIVTVGHKQGAVSKHNSDHFNHAVTAQADASGTSGAGGDTDHIVVDAAGGSTGDTNSAVCSQADGVAHGDQIAVVDGDVVGSGSNGEQV
jgi:hypothetical protein